MRVKSSYGKFLMLAIALVLMSGTLSFAKAFDYRFKVHNNTNAVTSRNFKCPKMARKWATLILALVLKRRHDELVWTNQPITKL